MISSCFLGEIAATLIMLFSLSKSTDKVPGVNEILFAKIVYETGLSKTVSMSTITGSIFLPIIALNTTSSVDLMIT